jgi:hypothetical protein
MASEGMLGAARVLRGGRFINRFTPSTLATERQRSCHSGGGRSGCFAVKRAGRGPRRQLSRLDERAAIHGRQEKENTMSTKKHTIYVINTADSGKSYWNRAGVAFENKDGSFTFKLDVFPQTKFQLREEKPFVKEEAAAE